MVLNERSNNMKSFTNHLLPAMKRVGLVSALSVLAALPLSGATRYRALLTHCDYGREQAHILLYDVFPDTWEYVRSIVHPFDGHCRVPGAAVLVGDVVYVTEWVGYDDRNAADRVSARILKYDLEGNYLGVFVDEIIDPDNKKVCRIEAITASPDGKYLYVNQPGYGNGDKCYIYRYRVSDGTGGSILGPYTSPAGPVCATSDGKTLIVVNSDNVKSGNVFVYSIDGDTFTLSRKYYKQSANCAYLDEDENLLYVCGLECGISVFDYSEYAGENPEPLFTSPATQYYPQIRKVGGELYASYMPGCRILRMSCDKANSKLTSTSVMPGSGLKLFTGTDAKCNRAYIFSDFSYEDPGAREVARYKFDEPANSSIFANSISAKYAMRSCRTQSGAAGVSGGALYFSEDYSHAVLEGSKGMLGGDYGIFMWFGCYNRTDTVGYILSNNMKSNNKGCFSLIMDCGKLNVANTLIDSIAITTDEDVLRDGKYHHIGVVKKGRKVSLWIDGVKKKSKDGPAGSLGLDDTMDFVLGGSADGHSRFMLPKSYLTICACSMGRRRMRLLWRCTMNTRMRLLLCQCLRVRNFQNTIPPSLRHTERLLRIVSHTSRHVLHRGLQSSRTATGG